MSGAQPHEISHIARIIAEELHKVDDYNRVSLERGYVRPMLTPLDAAQAAARRVASEYVVIREAEAA